MSSITRNVKCVIVVLSIIALPVLAMGYTPPVGIPNPSDSFGTIDPVEEVAPARPSGWPGLEVAGFYYINNSVNCSDDNSYGYPENPRCTIPMSTYGPGSYIEIHGGPYQVTYGSKRFQLDFDCTEENPCWFRGASPDQQPTLRGRIDVTGKYVFFENIQFKHQESSGKLSVNIGNKTHDAKFIIVRNNDASCDGQYHKGFGSVFSTRGVSEAKKTTHIVFFHNHIHDCGDDDAVIENDYHGILPSAFSEYIWALNNHIHDNGGDAMQIGSNNFVNEEMPRFIYVGNNQFHGDLENAVDVKNAKDVIVSSNNLYDYHLSPGSDGAIVVVHQQNGDIPTNIWFLNNRIHDGVRGIRAQQADNVKIIKNYIYDIHNEGGKGWRPTSPWSEGAAIMMRGVEGGEIIANTIYNCDIGVQSPNAPPGGYVIKGNVISNRTEAIGYDINMETAEASSSVFDNNLFFVPSGNSVILWRGSKFNLASFKSNIGKCIDCTEKNPQFVDAPQGDFRLQDTSPAKKYLERDYSIFNTFYSLYGLDISAEQVPSSLLIEKKIHSPVNFHIDE